MRIVLDVDGVIADFAGGALLEMRMMGFHFEPHQVVMWNMEQMLPEDRRAEWMDRVSAKGFCLGLPPYEQQIQALWNLQQRHEIVFATSPWKSEHWIPERTQWLRDMFLLASEINHTHDKTGVPGDIFVDDKPSHVDAWRRAQNGQAFIFDRPYNVDARGPRIRSLWDLVHIL